MLKIGIVGHLNLKENCIPFYKNKVYELLKSLKDKNHKILLYSSLADGADRLVIEVGMSLNIEYIAILPMEKSLYMIDFNNKSKIKFNYLLKNAISVIEIPSVKKIVDKNLQYEKAGRYISDNCDILIALWDGKYINLQGGTGETVQYYSKKAPFSLYHLLVSRSNDLTNNMVDFKLYDNKEKL